MSNQIKFKSSIRLNEPTLIHRLYTENSFIKNHFTVPVRLSGVDTIAYDEILGFADVNVQDDKLEIEGLITLDKYNCSLDVLNHYVVIPEGIGKSESDTDSNDVVKDYNVIDAILSKRAATTFRTISCEFGKLE